MKNLPNKIVVATSSEETVITSPLLIRLAFLTNGKNFHDRMIQELLLSCGSTWDLLHTLEYFIKERGKQYKLIALDLIKELDLAYSDKGFTFKQSSDGKQEEILLEVKSYLHNNSKWKVSSLHNHLEKKTGIKKDKLKTLLNEMFFKLIDKRVL